MSKNARGTDRAKEIEMELSLAPERNLKRMIKNLILTLVGTFITAVGVGFFVAPFELVAGGVTGLSIALRHVLVNVPFFAELTLEAYVTVFNWLLFFAGLIFLGKAFALKTLVSTFFFPVALSMTNALAGSGFLGNFFDLSSYTEFGEITVVIAAVFGGAIIGAGCAVTYLGGGSTGGLDVLAFILCKYIKSLKSSTAIFIFDAAVVVLGVFAINNFVISLLGIVSAFVCALSVDKVFLGADAVDFEGVSNSNFQEARIKAAAAECGEEVILLTDSSKFGKRALSRVCALDRIDTLITDKGISSEYKEELEKLRKQVIVT